MEIIKPLRILSQLNRKRTDPNEFIFTGTVPVEKLEIQLFKYNKSECLEDKAVLPGEIEKFDDIGYKYWLNVYGLNEPDTIAAICREQEIHDLVIQDILDINQRPKFQEFDRYSFLTIKSIVPYEEAMVTEQISIVFGDHFLLSFQEKRADYFEHVRVRLREDRGILRERGSDFLLYLMLEAILDNYFKTLGRVESEVDRFNFADFTKEPSPNDLIRIEQFKRFVHFIRKSLLPIKEFSMLVLENSTSRIEKRHMKYYYEIKDMCLALIDSCDMILASLESSTNLFFSVQGHRMNQVMKTLTIVATIFIPLTFIAGIYGMNFINMPELQWRYGYFAFWGIIVLVLLGMVYYFRKKRWF